MLNRLKALKIYFLVAIVAFLIPLQCQCHQEEKASTQQQQREPLATVEISYLTNDISGHYPPKKYLIALMNEELDVDSCLINEPNQKFQQQT